MFFYLLIKQGKLAYGSLDGKRSPPPTTSCDIREATGVFVAWKEVPT